MIPKCRVQSSMDSLINNNNIAKRVISSISIYMVNNLVLEKTSAQNLLRNPSMLLNSFSINSQPPVLSEVRNFLANSIAGLGAKLFNSLPTWRIEKFNSTAKAFKLNLGEVVWFLALNDRQGLSMKDVNSVFSETTTRTILRDMLPIWADKILLSTIFTDTIHDYKDIKNYYQTSGRYRIKCSKKS